MINDTSTGYWDYSNEIAPQWMEYGSPGAAPKPGTIAVGGSGNAAPVGAGGAPIGGANPIFTSGTPVAAKPKLDADYYFNAQFAPDFLHNSQGAYPNPIFSVDRLNPNPNPNPTQFTPNPFMTPGMTFQPRTQFGQQASAPLNLSQQGRTYGQIPGGPNTAQQVPAFQSVRPGGPMPQFQNPFGPQQQPPGEEVGIGDFMRDQLRNIYGPQTQQTQQPQQYRQMGQQPTQISQQPLQQTGLPSLLREYRPGDNLVMSSNGVRIS